MATILAIQISPSAGKKMQQLQVVKAIEGKGLNGDRYALNAGAYLQGRPQDPIRHVTFLDKSQLDGANAVALPNVVWTFADTRRNILTVGWDDINEFIGKIFQFGPAIFRGFELADPCDRPTSLSGKRGFKHDFTERGGLRAEILHGGLFGIQDKMALL